MHVNVAVEENTGWDDPQLWKSMHGASTHSCGGLYGVRAPVAVEKHRGWEHPQPHRSMWCACTHSYGRTHGMRAPALM